MLYQEPSMEILNIKTQDMICTSSFYPETEVEGDWAED